MVRASSVPGAFSRRAANSRMIALAGAVAVAVVLPLAAATAGPASLSGREKPRQKVNPAKERAKGQELIRPAGFRGPGAAGAPLRPDDDRSGPAGLLGLGGSRDSYGPYGAGTDDPDRGSARCGPELASPEGVEAQTCVLERAGDTWARTYYRNATGTPLAGVLTLMAPAGRTVQVHCRLAATDDPDLCETPHEPTLRGHGSYAAVAEIASTEGKLMLRSGSNSPAADED
ncbi:hypothetical protein AB0F13_07945 [Streptomyces sp. NPDC026206]|uniref:hypothetical protein n=1 Tax=Streptomyces sp. NPDC026206 TaxID=3157089 RepID=UPI0034112431